MTRYLRPFEDRRRRIPDIETMREVKALTGGAITVLDWYPADLHPDPPPADEDYVRPRDFLQAEDA